MARNEIVMRLMSAEAQVPLSHMRVGIDVGCRLAEAGAHGRGRSRRRRCSSTTRPNMSMMEIRAKCRRLKQKHDLRLVIVDYLQLMSSGKKVESRQQEVAEFSRALKLLAKELELPVVAI